METETTSAAAAAIFVDDLLEHEVAAASWMQEQVRESAQLPIAEADILVSALRGIMRSVDGRIPRSVTETGDSFHAAHAVNVAVLTMAVADHLKLDEAAVRRIGGAALLHDAGMWRLPTELLAKQETLTDEDRRQIKEHPIEGARLILAADGALDLAAVVAYEHHIRMDGSGYPHFHYARAPHYISRLVQVCDVFHALQSPRPFRKPWPLEFVLSFLNERAGFEFHPGLVESLTRMIERGGSDTQPAAAPAR
jgi:HD-GYP domain-containing protein (c-di-GMP phosphodiesterase class II)